jgi:hypothetical protein
VRSRAARTPPAPDGGGRWRGSWAISTPAWAARSPPWKACGWCDSYVSRAQPVAAGSVQ